MFLTFDIDRKKERVELEITRKFRTWSWKPWNREGRSVFPTISLEPKEICSFTFIFQPENAHKLSGELGLIDFLNLEIMYQVQYFEISLQILFIFTKEILNIFSFYVSGITLLGQFLSNV